MWVPMQHEAQGTGKQMSDQEMLMIEDKVFYCGEKHRQELTRDGKLGNNKPGDGYRYRGRAYLHITGKWMYNHIGKNLGIDLVKHPELLEKPDIAAKASIWYWNNIVKPSVRDFNDVIAVTAKVQGGAGGLGDRATNFDDYKRKLKV